uniref:Endonuclease G, mitochondrial n=3 Tax=Culex pipiens TaxID=7175 RepID=A0A8D8IFM0_CULPI
MNCTVEGCGNSYRKCRGSKGFRLHGYPVKRPEVCEQWKIFSGWNGKLTNAKICSHHFIPDDYFNETNSTSPQAPILLEYAVPSVGGCTRWQQQQQQQFQPVPEDDLSNAVEDIKLEDVADFSQFPLTAINYQDIIDQINRRLATEPSVMVWINKMAVPDPYPAHPCTEQVPLYNAAAEQKPQHWLKEKMEALGSPDQYCTRWFSQYVRSYDQRFRIPFWTFEWLTEDMFGKGNRSSNYPVDEELHPFFRSHLNDFKGTEFDCGHFVCAGNHSADKCTCYETFVMSNMAPQIGAGFNRGVWKALENHVRRLTRTYANVYVYTGSLLVPEELENGESQLIVRMIGNNKVVVPTHFFKFVLLECDDATYELESFCLPNIAIDSKKSQLGDFLMDPEEVQRYAGQLFFGKVPADQIRRVNDQRFF